MSHTRTCPSNRSKATLGVSEPRHEDIPPGETIAYEKQCQTDPLPELEPKDEGMLLLLLFVICLLICVYVYAEPEEEQSVEQAKEEEQPASDAEEQQDEEDEEEQQTVRGTSWVHLHIYFFNAAIHLCICFSSTLFFHTHMCKQSHSPTCCTELDEEEAEAIMVTSDFQEFFNHSSLLVDRVLMANDKYNPLVDYAAVEETEEYDSLSLVHLIMIMTVCLDFLACFIEFSISFSL